MFLCRNQFSTEIDRLISHLKSEEKKEAFFKTLLQKCEPENTLKDTIEEHIEQVIKPSHTSSKEFTYRSSIVSIYGFLEQLIENIAEEFISNINEIGLKKYSIPSKIFSSNLSLTADLIKNTQSKNSISERDRNDKIKQLVSNLNSVFQDEKPYYLNGEAFTLHTSNFRLDSIQSFFSRIGIESIQRELVACEPLKEQLLNRVQQEPTDDNKTIELWLSNQINDLVQLRNEISHGGFKSNIEVTELIISRACFIRSFGVALADIVYRHFEYQLFKGFDQNKIGKPSNVFPQHNCIGFKEGYLFPEEEHFTIRIGDQLFASNENSPIKTITGKVLSLRQNDCDIEEISIPSQSEFSMQVSFDVTNGMDNREISSPKKDIS